MHKRIAERIADSANLSQNDTVLEIGPGTGMLTKPLLDRAKKVIAIEMDPELVTKLREMFADDIATKKLELYECDVRSFDLSKIVGDYSLVANIPYYITGEIIRRFLETTLPPRNITILVQKEVANRIARDTKESILSVSVKVYGTPKCLFTVPRGAFKPAPNVDSAVLSISNIKSPFKNQEQARHFFDILHTGFAHKRKKLLKNLSGFSKIDMSKIFKEMNIDENIRAEDISVETWSTLAQKII